MFIAFHIYYSIVYHKNSHKQYKKVLCDAPHGSASSRLPVTKNDEAPECFGHVCRWKPYESVRTAWCPDEQERRRRALMR
jgi:hypothetical protein